jgi:Na+/H+ antiporter NhaD/arsenite permease-like protein
MSPVKRHLAPVVGVLTEHDFNLALLSIVLYHEKIAYLINNAPYYATSLSSTQGSGGDMAGKEKIIDSGKFFAYWFW